MSDADFHKAIFGSVIPETQPTFPFSCRLEADMYADIAAISSHFNTTKTFVVQSLLKSALADFYSTLDHKHCTAIQAASEGYAQSLLEGK